MKKVPMTPATELKVNNIRGFYIRKVKPVGTSAKVDCPNSWPFIMAAFDSLSIKYIGVYP
jgi:putative transposon-encoded protein